VQRDARGDTPQQQPVTVRAGGLCWRDSASGRIGLVWHAWSASGANGRRD
jgi:hypothetical protein